jgi:hypothetical protein
MWKTTSFILTSSIWPQPRLPNPQFLALMRRWCDNLSANEARGEPAEVNATVNLLEMLRREPRREIVLLTRLLAERLSNVAEI